MNIGFTSVKTTAFALRVLPYHSVSSEESSQRLPVFRIDGSISTIRNQIHILKFPVFITDDLKITRNVASSITKNCENQQHKLKDDENYIRPSSGMTVQMRDIVHSLPFRRINRRIPLILYI